MTVPATGGTCRCRRVRRALHRCRAGRGRGGRRWSRNWSVAVESRRGRAPRSPAALVALSRASPALVVAGVPPRSPLVSGSEAGRSGHRSACARGCGAGVRIDRLQAREVRRQILQQLGRRLLRHLRARGIVFQLLTVEKYFDRYQVCVRAPTGGRKCLTSLVRPQGRLYGSHLRWPRRVGHHGNGVYRVTWSQSGVRLGPPLRFRER